MSPLCITILNMKKNAGDLKMSLKQARKLFVLERLCEGRISNREAASYLDLSIRQTQRAKSRSRKVGVEPEAYLLRRHTC